MPVYLYTAIDPQSNRTSEGTIEARTPRDAKDMLREQGAIPIELQEDRSAMNVENAITQVPLLGKLFRQKIGLKDLNIFTQQLYTLLEAGLPMIEALFLLEQQTSNRRLKVVLKSVREDIIAGDSFSNALSKFPDEFNKLYVSMMRAGESSGNMDGICKRLAMLLEKYMLLNSKIQGALIYPAFAVLVIVGVVVLIMLVVVPQFQSMFAGAGDSLPLPTVVLIAISEYFQKFWWAMAVGVMALVFWFQMFRTGKGKPIVDQWVLTIPLFGDVVRKVYISRFIRTLSTVFSAGVPLTEGLRTAADTVDNVVLRNSFQTARDSILVGGSMSKPLEKTRQFPLMVVKMMAIGEETGNLESMMEKASDFLDLEVDSAIEAMTKLIEPIMIIVLGGMLLGVALALYLPLFDLHKVVAK
jgi:type IV pilus assembly protein PilC